mmetsp:Transcript_76044/g.163230  ORF Transcript_76044/g.163230 Transcript_76044/m.163230 type:complete len:336 (+) Transcript_76044:938-1945(+)
MFVLDAVELHAHRGSLRGAELQLSCLPLVVASAVFLCDCASEDGRDVLVPSLLYRVGRDRKHRTVEELDELLASDAQRQILQDQSALHNLLVRELGHSVLDTWQGHEAGAASRNGGHRKAPGIRTPLGLPLPWPVVTGRLVALLLLVLLAITLRRSGASLLLDLVLVLLVLFVLLGPGALPLHLGLDIRTVFVLHILRLRFVALPFQLVLHIALLVLDRLVLLLSLHGHTLHLHCTLVLHVGALILHRIYALYIHLRLRLNLNADLLLNLAICLHLHGSRHGGAGLAPHSCDVLGRRVIGLFLLHLRRLSCRRLTVHLHVLGGHPAGVRALTGAR